MHRAQARIVKYILKKQKDATFSYVTTTAPDGTITKKVLCEENQRKYHLVYQTPIANTPLKEDFGLNGLIEKSISVATGDYEAPIDIEEGIKE